MKEVLVRRLMLIAIGAAMLVAVAPEAQAKTVTPINGCAQTVTTNAVLTHDLSCDVFSGIVVGASGITIDLNGFVIRGDRDSVLGGAGVDLGDYDKVTIKNGVLRDFEYYGVYANGSDGIVLSNLVISGNAGDGIQIHGNSTTITSSTVARNVGEGISVTGDSTSISSTNASGNSDFGIALGGNSTTIKSAIANGNGTGIYVAGDSTTVSSSSASVNGGNGIVVEGGSNSIASSSAFANRFTGILMNGEELRANRNRADANGFGIRVTSLNTVPVGKNSARGNDNPSECDPTNLC